MIKTVFIDRCRANIALESFMSDDLDYQQVVPSNEVFGAIFEALGNFVKWIVEKIKDFWNWLFGGSSSSSGSSSAIESAKKREAEIEKARRENAERISRVLEENNARLQESLDSTPPPVSTAIDNLNDIRDRVNKMEIPKPEANEKIKEIKIVAEKNLTSVEDFEKFMMALYSSDDFIPIYGKGLVDDICNIYHSRALDHMLDLDSSENPFHNAMLYLRAMDAGRNFIPTLKNLNSKEYPSETLEKMITSLIDRRDALNRIKHIVIDKDNMKDDANLCKLAFPRGNVVIQSGGSKDSPEEIVLEYVRYRPEHNDNLAFPTQLVINETKLNFEELVDRFIPMNKELANIMQDFKDTTMELTEEVSKFAEFLKSLESKDIDTAAKKAYQRLSEQLRYILKESVTSVGMKIVRDVESGLNAYVALYKKISTFP